MGWFKKLKKKVKKGFKNPLKALKTNLKGASKIAGKVSVWAKYVPIVGGTLSQATDLIKAGAKAGSTGIKVGSRASKLKSRLNKLTKGASGSLLKRAKKTKIKFAKSKILAPLMAENDSINMLNGKAGTLKRKFGKKLKKKFNLKMPSTLNMGSTWKRRVVQHAEENK